MILAYSARPYFQAMVLAGLKIHTFRTDNRWRQGMSIQHYTSSPRNPAKHPEVFMENKALKVTTASIGSVVGIDMVMLDFGGEPIRKLKSHELEIIARNDGLTMKEFMEYFTSQLTQEDDVCWNGKLIQWTDFNYSNPLPCKEFRRDFDENYEYGYCDDLEEYCYQFPTMPGTGMTEATYRNILNRIGYHSLIAANYIKDRELAIDCFHSVCQAVADINE